MSHARLSWKQVRDRIYRTILAGNFRPGDKLPRDADFAKELKCARSTVQRAMHDLSNSGVVERKRKDGTRVRSDPIARATFDIPITRKEVEQKGKTYGYRMLSREMQLPPNVIQARLEQSIKDLMLHIKSLHFADAQPYIFEDRWINVELVPEILDVDLESISANEWLVKNRPYDNLTVRFYAENAGSERSRLLNIGANESVLIIERTTWIGGEPITTVKASATSDYQVKASTNMMR